MNDAGYQTEDIWQQKKVLQGGSTGLNLNISFVMFSFNRLFICIMYFAGVLSFKPSKKSQQKEFTRKHTLSYDQWKRSMCIQLNVIKWSVFVISL